MHSQQPALWSIPEQVVHDSTGALTLHFHISPDGRPQLRILGDVPFGRGQFEFSPAEGSEPLSSSPSSGSF